MRYEEVFGGDEYVFRAAEGGNGASGLYSLVR